MFFQVLLFPFFFFFGGGGGVGGVSEVNLVHYNQLNVVNTTYFKIKPKIESPH